MTEPLNPYAPPQALEQPQQRLDGSWTIQRPYQSARTFTTVVVCASAIDVVLHIGLIVSFCMQLSILYPAQGGIGIDPNVANSNDTRHHIVTAFEVLAMLITFVVLLMWVYRTHANLFPLGASPLEFSSGWAVGWFFVPIANLVKPYQAASEIWSNSQPNRLLGQVEIGTQLVGWWWGLRIISGIAGRVLTTVSNHADTAESLIAVSWAAIILTALVNVPLAVCQIFLVRRVQQFQDERHALVTAQLASSPVTGDNPFAI